MNKEQNRILPPLDRQQLSRYICPLLLACSVFFSSIYTFHKPSAYVLTAVFFFECVFLFRLFDRLKGSKSGAFIYALIFAVVFFISFLLVAFHSVNYGMYSPLRWFYAQDDADEFVPDLIAALFIGGGFFLISIIYYFTMIRFRTLGVMLCTMFPFFFFAKRSDIMPDILITLIMLMFLAVIIHNRRIAAADRDGGKGSRLQTDRAYIISIAVFILITGAITMALEKPSYQAFLERNSRLFDPFGLNLRGSSGYEELSERSSPRNAQPDYDYEPLFYVETDSDAYELFLRSKAYDVFDGDVWVSSEVYSYSYYSLQVPEYSTDDVVSDMSALTKADASGAYRISSARLYDESFSPRYLPAPYGIITDNRPANSLRYFKLRSDTSVQRRIALYYNVPLDDSFEFSEALSGLYGLAEQYNFSSAEYLDFLDGFADSDEAERLREDYERARKAYTDMSNISPRLAELSQRITADCHSDLEKAQKLEKYFSENGFVYSLEYLPPDNSIDYFVFESKTGYCAGYATAMTLMARAVGLPARYVEGFAAFERTQDGSIVVRDGYAHAFVEVYIPGAGWLTFDPTVSDYRSIPDVDTDSGGFGFLAGLINIFNRLSTVIVIAAAVAVFSLLDLIRELWLRIILHFMPINERIIRLYGNTLKLAGKSAGEDFTAYTPDMLREYLKHDRGAVPEQLISLFEKTAFGSYECSDGEYADAYRQYRQCYKYLRRRPRDSGKRRKQI